MKKKTNKRAFTMVELLVTIAVLGIISTIVILGITGILKKSRESYYDSEREMIVLAAKEYYADNRSKLPKEIGPINEVTLKELIELKYIEPVKDAKGKECVINEGEKESKVTVQKVSNNKYVYEAYLYCSGEESGIFDNEAPIVTLTPNEKVAKTRVIAKLKAEDNNEVMSYKYVIYKDGELYKQVGYKLYKKEVEIDLNETGIYEIEAYAYDKSGNKGEAKGKYDIEILPPACGEVDISLLSGEDIIAVDTWTNVSETNLNININTETIEKWEVKDKIVNGDITSAKIKVNNTTERSKEVELTEDGEHTVTFTGYNSKGESCTSEIVYKIDKTSPSCEIGFSGTVGQNGWYRKENVTVTLDKEDTGGSEIVKYGMGTTDEEHSNEVTSVIQGNTTGVTYYGYVEDSAGNKTTCSNSVKVDTDYPVINFGTGTYYSSGIPNFTAGYYFEYKFTSSDNISGIGSASDFSSAFCIMYNHCYEEKSPKCSTNGYDIYSAYPPNQNYVKCAYDGGAYSYRNATLHGYYKICDLAGNCVFYNRKVAWNRSSPTVNETVAEAKN